MLEMWSQQVPELHPEQRERMVGKADIPLFVANAQPGTEQPGAGGEEHHTSNGSIPLVFSAVP